MKKLFLAFFVSLFAVVMLVSASAETLTAGNYQYTVNADGTSATIVKYNGTSASDVTVPSEIDTYTVTALGEYAFQYINYVKSITVPEGVTSISRSTFYNCHNLQNVYLPGSLKAIPERAFQYCYNLISVELSEGTETVATKAFNECIKLSTVKIPSTVNSIGAMAFFDMPNCTVEISEANETYSSDGKGLLSADGKAYLACLAVTRNRIIKVPDGVETIAAGACPSEVYTNALYLPESVKNVEASAFSNPPQNVYYGGTEEAFASVSTENNFHYSNIIYGITDIDEITRRTEFYYENNEDGTGITITGSLNFDGGCVVPSTIEGLEVTAIDGLNLYNVSKLFIPSTVKSIGNKFLSTYYIENIFYEGTESEWSEISIDAENEHFINTAVIFNAIPDDVNIESEFEFLVNPDGTVVICGFDDEEYSEITIPDKMGRFKVTEIGDEAFRYTDISSLSIPEGITKIGNAAFEYCYSLTSVKLPDSLTTIGERAFSGCRELELIIPKNVNYYGAEAFEGVKSCTFSEENKNFFTSEEGIVFSADMKILFSTPEDFNYESYKVPEGVEEIVGRAFYNRGNLQYITLPSTLKKIGDYAFAHSYSLKDLSLPSSLEEIGENAFYDCDVIKAVTVPGGIKVIQRETFSSCDSLTSVTLSEGVEEICDSAFSYCRELKTVKAPSTVKSIHSYAFFESNNAVLEISEDNAFYSVSGRYLLSRDGKTLLGYMDTIDYSFFIIPSGVEAVAENVYENYFSSLYIPKSVTSIHEEAFNGVYNIYNVYYEGTEEEYAAVVGASSFYSAELHYGVLSPGEVLAEVMFDYNISDDGTAVITRYKGEDANVSIPSEIAGYTVTGIEGFGNNYSVRAINIPESVSYIADNVLSQIRNLGQITVAEGNTSYAAVGNVLFNAEKTKILFIPKYNSDGNNVYTYKIPAGVTEITPSAFTHIRTIEVAEGNTSFAAKDGVLFTYDMTKLVFYPRSIYKRAYAIPEGVKTVGESAFYTAFGIDSGYLYSVYIPASVEAIEQNAFECRYTYDNENASWNQKVRIFYGGSEEAFASISVADGNEILSFAEKHYDGSTSDMTAVSSVNATVNADGTLTVTRIYNSSDEKRLVIPSKVGGYTVTAMQIAEGYSSFFDYNSFKSVFIPKSIVSIGENVFRYMYQLQIVLYEGTEEEWSSIQISSGNETLLDAEMMFETSESDVTIETDFEFEINADKASVTITGYTGSDTALVIPEMIGKYTVTAVNELDIDYNVRRNISSITVPGCVKTIGENAFNNCNNVSEINIGDGVEYIGNYAFYGARKLTALNIPEGVLEIGSSAFGYLPELCELSLPDSLTSIGYCAFYGCDGLTEVTIPKNVSYYGSAVFSGCDSLKEIKVSSENPNFVSIDGVLFSHDKTRLIEYPYGIEATEYTVPDSVKVIGNSAFYSTMLESIILPDSVTKIEDSAFYNCYSITEIAIPRNVSKIGLNAFFGCDNLMNINVASENAFYKSTGGVLFTKDGKTLIVYPYGKAGYDSKTVYSVPDGTVEIADSAFYGTRIVGVMLPSSLKKIGASAFADTSLKEIDIPDSVNYIGKEAFRSCSFKLFKLPSGISSVTEGMLRYCDSIVRVYIPLTVKEIGSSAFGYGDNIEKIFYEGSLDEWISVNVHEDNYALENAEIVYNASIDDFLAVPTFSYRDDYESEGIVITGYNLNVPTVVIPSEFDGRRVVAVGENAFLGNDIITSVIISEGVERIEMCAFSNCEALSSVSLPDSLTYIGYNAFSSSRNLSNITVPKNVSHIGEGAFYYCDVEAIYVDDENVSYCSIDGVLFTKDKTTVLAYPRGKQDSNGMYYYSYALPEGTLNIGGHAFAGCYRLRGIALPDSLVSIGAYAFDNCYNLKNIAIPENVQNIKTEAFRSCRNLNSVYIPASVTYLSADTFSYCESLVGVYYGGTEAEWSRFGCDVGSAMLYFEQSVEDFENETKFGYEMSEDGSGYIINSYNGTDANLVIPSSVNGVPVVGIGYEAFENNTLIKSVTIPGSITQIGSYAFGNCQALTEIIFSEPGLKTLENSAFYKCTALKSIALPESLRNIGNNCFHNCRSLEEVKLPSTLLSIGDSAFAQCTMLTNVKLPDGLAHIGSYAFQSCRSLTEITIPAGVKTIGITPVAYCYELAAIEVSPENTVFSEIDGVLLGDGGKLLIEYPSGKREANYSIPSSVTAIGDFAFRGAGFETLSMHENVKELAPAAFAYSHIESFDIASGNRSFKCVDGVLYSYDKTVLICFSRSFEGEFSVPSTVKTIGAYAFYDCYGITEISLPYGITEIGEYAFTSCENLKEITLPESVTVIGTNAFSSCGFESFIIPGKVTEIERNTFSNCYNLAKVFIPSSVTYIAPYAFDAYRLSTVYYEGTADEFDAIKKETYGYEMLQMAYKYYEADASDMNENPEYYVRFNEDMNSLIITQYNGTDKNVVLPEELYGYPVTGIESNAFGGSLVESLTISSSISYINGTAFNGVKSFKVSEENSFFTAFGGVLFTKGMTELVRFPDVANVSSYNIPEGVSRIGNYAFMATDLTSVKIPSSVTSIGYYAFANMHELTSITLPEGLTSVSHNVFNYCSKLQSVVIPSSLSRIGEEMFYGCKALTRVTIADGVKVIGEAAFAECYSLEKLILPASITSIEANAFGECVSLKRICFEGTEEKFNEINVYVGNEAFTAASVEFEYVQLSEPGDVDEDGSVSIQDLVRLAQYLANWSVTVDSDASDCDGDGNVSIQDLVRLAQYLANWNVTLG